jgi:hypothetical protein
MLAEQRPFADIETSSTVASPKKMKRAGWDKNLIQFVKDHSDDLEINVTMFQSHEGFMRITFYVPAKDAKLGNLEEIYQAIQAEVKTATEQHRAPMIYPALVMSEFDGKEEISVLEPQ